MTGPFDLQRFLDAQSLVYPRVLAKPAVRSEAKPLDVVHLPPACRTRSVDKGELMSKTERRIFSREFKLKVIERLEAGERGTALALELSVKRTIIYRWRDAWHAGGAEGGG
jgi:hypothetical protein